MFVRISSVLAILLTVCLSSAAAAGIEVARNNDNLLIIMPEDAAERVKEELRVILPSVHAEDLVNRAVCSTADGRYVLEIKGCFLNFFEQEADDFVDRLKTHLEEKFSLEEIVKVVDPNACCSCNTCDFGSPCCVCNDIDFISACTGCTLRARSPEPAEIESPNPIILPPLQPQTFVQPPTTVLPRLSLTFLNRWSATSPRSPKTPRTASPKSANSNPNSPSSPGIKRFLSRSSSDAEVDESN